MLNLITHGTNLPVSLAVAKQQCRVDFTNDDALITAYIWAATDLVERETSVDLCTNTYLFSGHYTDMVDAVLTLKRRPLQKLNSVKYFDGSNTLQSWTGPQTFNDETSPAGNYYLTMGQKTYPQITPATIWAIFYPLRPDALQVNFTGGYDSSLGNVPARRPASNTNGRWSLIRTSYRPNGGSIR